MATAGFAEIVAGDLHPLELGRGGEHLLEQLPVGSLYPSAVIQRSARVGHLRRQGIADRLQPTEVECPRLPGGGWNRHVELDPTKSFSEEAAELVLQATDLAPQLGAGEELVATDKKLNSAISIK